DVTGNGISKLVFTILNAVAEAERDQIRERVATVKANQRTRNHYLNNIAPFGWRVGEDNELAEVAEQQAAIRTMRSLRAQGASLRQIAVAMGVTGHTISHERVAGVLRGHAAP